MGKNYLEELKKDNGITDGERFSIVGVNGHCSDNCYYFENNDLFFVSAGGRITEKVIMNQLLSGILSIKKNLKKINFGTAYWIYNNVSDKYSVVSCENGINFCQSFFKFSLKDFQGKWTVTGLYEDDDLDDWIEKHINQET